jgi:hypothetical protein
MEVPFQSAAMTRRLFSRLPGAGWKSHLDQAFVNQHFSLANGIIMKR